MASNIDATKPTTTTATTQSVRNNFAAAKAEIEALQESAGIADGSITDAKIGNRTIDQSLSGGATTGLLTSLLSWIGKAIKATSGETDWYDAPGTTLKSHVANSSNPHTVTTGQLGLSASTGATLIGFIQAGTSAVLRTLLAKTRERVSVQDFGVSGDGSDESDALQACFTYAASIGAVAEVPGELTIKITKKITQNCKVISHGGTINVAIANSTTYPFAWDCGNDLAGLILDRTNAVTGTSAINMIASDKIVRNGQIRDFFGYAFKSPSGVTGNILYNNIIDSCGRYSDFEVVYLFTGCVAARNTVTNARYKGIITGTAADNVLMLNNIVDTTTGPSEGLYFSPSTTDSAMIGNVIRNTPGIASIKTSHSVARCSIFGNICDQSIFSNGGTSNRIVGNYAAGGISAYSHVAPASPESNTHIIANSCGGAITLGYSGEGDTNGLVILGNICTTIEATRASLANTRIDSNYCTKIDLVIDKAARVAGIDTDPIVLTNNRVVFTTGTGFKINGQTSHSANEGVNVIVQGNYVKGPSGATASSVGYEILNSSKITIVGNTAESVESGFRVGRLDTLRLINNIASIDIGATGFNLVDSGSASEWPGADHVIDNNVGSFVSVASRIPMIYRAQSELYASAAPVGGYHKKGEYRINNDPDSAEFFGWVCTVAGTPGTWKTFGLIS